jgi:hypothetical protein
MRTLISALAAALLAAAPTVQAALDSTAQTDDHSINMPTAWWTYQNLTPTQLNQKMAELNARAVDLEVTSVSNRVPKLMVRLVGNTGAYAIAGATFVSDMTQAQLESHLNGGNRRLIELERYDAGGGDIRYAALAVPNTGATARGWGWLTGRTRSEIQSWVSANNQRIIDLDSFGTGSSRRWNAVTVTNSGSDNKRWEWDVNQTMSQILARLSSFQGRLVKVEPQSDGKFSFVQVDNTGSNGTSWWHSYQFASLGDANNFVNQMGARPIDILRYTSGGKTYYGAVAIDNANAATRAVRGKFFEEFIDTNGWPVGIFEAYLKRIDTNETIVHLNASRRAETASALKALHLLHAMKRVNAGDPLGSSFTYYNYPTDHDDLADACPDPAYENGSWDQQTTLESGLDWMMNNSDNRTTRGVVIRYGGFPPLNTTAQQAGLVNTVLRHNIGCAYRNLATGEYSPSTMRNDTTAADLASLWIGVHKGTILSGLGRSEFLESGNPKSGANNDLQAVIDEEAAALGISASEAARFGGRVKTWGKGGSYGTCLPLASDPAQCGQPVTIASTAGLLSLPIGGGQWYALRTYGYSTLMSDVPVPDWNGGQADAFKAAYRAAHYESLRQAVRAALQEW